MEAIPMCLGTVKIRSNTT